MVTTLARLIFFVWLSVVCVNCIDWRESSGQHSTGAEGQAVELPNEKCCAAVLCLVGEGDESSNVMLFCGKEYAENIDFLNAACRLEWVDLADACDKPNS